MRAMIINMFITCSRFYWSIILDFKEHSLHKTVKQRLSFLKIQKKTSTIDLGLTMVKTTSYSNHSINKIKLNFGFNWKRSHNLDSLMSFTPFCKVFLIKGLYRTGHFRTTETMRTN